LVFGVICCLSVCHAAELVVSAGPKTPEEERNAFKLPPGFEAQLVASEPDIHKPINLAFDDRGRLWVTDTVEYPFPVPQGSKTPDSVKILEDFAPDGHALKITTFADNLDIPIGVLPREDDSALVYSIPYIWRMTDTQGTGHADKSERFLGTYDHVDTHGMTGSFTEGFDGWIYAVHGYRNTSTITASDGSSITMNSGNVYRFKRDGSHVEYFTHGQVNPFGLCFDPLGNLYSSDCETMPIAMLFRGAYYPSFGKPDDGLGFAPNIIDHFYGSTAIAGLCGYFAEQYPAAFRNRMFVGNVMTNKVNDAQMTPRGSGVHGDDVPDFLVSSDAWFRPTNIKLGPDGALYVADFYNRIIGHYEVDLHHPGRDKQRGRIWRIVYKGTDAVPAPQKKFDLTKASVGEMVEYLASPNFTIRMLAMNRLADIVGQEAVEPVRKMLGRSTSVYQKVHGLWILYRLGAMDSAARKVAATDPSPLIREHSMRILGEMPSWEAGDRQLVLDGLGDADPLVRRTAAEALGRHPQFENVRPLLDLMDRSDNDVFINHVTKIALRDQFLVPGVGKKLMAGNFDDRDDRTLARSAVGAPTPDAAGWLLAHVSRGNDKPEEASQYLKAVARYVPAEQIDQLAGLVETKFANDLDVQRSLFEAVRQGLDQRGVAPGEAVRAWGSSLATKLFARAASSADVWRYQPLPGSIDTRSPWGVQIRKSIDGDASSPFLSSLVHGEQLMGIARSQPFAAPAKLTFYMAGHNGPPRTTSQRKNQVRIRDVRTNEVLAFAMPPRNDTAKQITMDLSQFEGRQVYFEAVDAMNGTGFSWLAVGRFDPPVIAVPISGPQLQSAVYIVQSLHLSSLAGEIEKLLANASAETEVRAAAARTLGALDPLAHIQALARAVQDPQAPDSVREAAAGVLSSVNSPVASSAMVEAMRTAPQNLQIALAQSLASGQSGAEALLAAIEQGKASPRLLLDSNVRERLGVMRPANFDERLKKLTAGLPAADAAVQTLIDQRAAAFDATAASSQRGKLVFEKNCMVCHTLAGQGTHIGPPLDGIGIRGVPRLCEDILDPSRNVAAEFRQSTFVLSDGNVIAGIPRRQEGQTVVVADSTGKEVSIPKSQITRQVESKLSLMPSNFGEVIPPPDFNDLLSYLLSTKQQ
jgi:putative heme-binding domain-containing protein